MCGRICSSSCSEVSFTKSGIRFIPVPNPVPIVVEGSGETIDPKSHVNFGRVYTVEHNVKVSKVGRIAPEYLLLLDPKFVDTIGQAA